MLVSIYVLFHLTFTLSLPDFHLTSIKQRNHYVHFQSDSTPAIGLNLGH